MEQAKRGPRAYKSLIFKISIVVLLVECAGLVLIGGYYYDRFSDQIDRQVLSQVQLPGILMNRQLLRYESVADKGIMTELVGEEFVNGLVVGVDRKVYYAFDPQMVGRDITEVPEITPEWFGPQITRTRIFTPTGPGISLASVTPLVAYEGASPFFFAYIQVHLNQSERQKKDIARLFIMGSLLCLAFTSLVIIALLRRIVVNPLAGLSEQANEFAGGALDQPIDTRRTDELGDLARSFAHMRNAIRSQIADLTRLNRQVADQNRQLETAKEAAETANEAKSRFLANMSHEIRTPLNGVIASTDLALAENLSPKVRNYLRIIYNSGYSLLGVINDILDFSKIEAGQLQLEKQPFDLDEVLGKVKDIFTGKAREKQIHFTIHREDDVLRILTGDALRLHQILTNLVSNAIKFTPENGRITLRIQCPEPKHQRQEVVLRFEVRDTGIGIAEDRITTLFKPFVQADVSVTRKYGGSGLGLCICKQLVEMMAGKISVSSRQGQGSTFVFTVRLEKPPQGVLPASAHQKMPVNSKKRLKGIRVLVAEDNPTNQEIARAVLEGAKMQVFMVENGRLAVEEVQRQKFDVILMDVQMPEMDGNTATRVIREWEKKQGRESGIRNWELEEEFTNQRDQTLIPNSQFPIPIIAMTAHAMKGDEEKCIEAGMNGYVTKPIRQKTLFRTLCEVLGKDHNSPAETEFVRRHRQTFKRIQDAHRAQEHERLMAVAGELESDAQSIGALKIRNLCNRITKLCTTQTSISQSLIDHLEAEMNDLIESLEG